MSSEPNRQLLPTNVKPLHYVVQLDPSFETYEIDGHVIINLDVLEDASEISLHKADIDIHDIELTRSDDKVEQPRSTRYDESTEVFTILLEKLLKKGSNVSLKITFKSQLNNKGVGFYRVSYQDDERTKILAASQMQAVDARKAFPCFDEPGLKATFAITLFAAKEHACLSNMNAIETTELDNGRKKVVFAPTPVMSTYLVAFTIGELDYIESTDFRFPIRIYAAPATIKRSAWSLELATKVTRLYEELFDLDYPLPKLDLVGLPEGGGAMENWGLIICSESLLIWDPEHGSARTKNFVISVIAHEISHQWFGNIVTMQFWDGLWLNEGFATWMAWFASNHFYPELNVWQQFVYSSIQQALKLDSLPSTHPVEVPVTTSNDINQIFDAIAYSKGSCIIQMIASSLGTDVFFKGIRLYLKRFAYGSTTTVDLWDALSEASGTDVKKVMSVWTEKPGYPVITVTERDGGLHLRQNRYVQSTDTAKIDDIIYPVFLTMRTDKGEQTVLFQTRELELPLGDLDFYKLNTNNQGLYRTLYSPERVQKLGKASTERLLTPEDRIGLLADASALASTGQQSTTALLDLLDSIGSETETFVWLQALTNLATFEAAWYYQPTEIKDAIRAFERLTIVKRINEIGWDFADDEDVSSARQKSRLFHAAGLAGEESVILAAKKMFASIIEGNDKTVNPNLRETAYSVAVKYGSKGEFDAALQLFQSTKNQSDREYILAGLAHTEDPECLQELYKLLLSDRVSGHMLSYAFMGLEHGSRVQTWLWLKEQWDVIDERIGQGLGGLGARVIQPVVQGLSNPELLEDVEKFLGGKDASKWQTNLAQAMDVAKSRIAWVERDAEAVKGWLAHKGYLET